MYVELHAHSAFSFLDGASTPLELAAAAASHGYPAFALTDHDGLWGAMEFAHACRGLGVHPIAGTELTLRLDGPKSPPQHADGPICRPGRDKSARRRGEMDTSARRHLTLLAEDATGYRNLCRLLTLAHAHTRARSELRNPPATRPWATLEQLEEHSEGLVCLSGCARDGVLAGAFERGDTAGGERLARRLLGAFGRERLRVELQRPYWRRDRARNRWQALLAERLEVPCVATGNVHAHDRRRSPLQDALVAIARGETLEESEPFRRGNSTSALASPAAMAARFAEHPEAVAETGRLAERLRFDLTEQLGYRYPGSEDPGADAELARLCAHHLAERYSGSARLLEAQWRLEEELATIRKLGLSGFFLLHRDLLELAREVAAEVRGPESARGVLPPGRGRGSSVSSIVCYLTGLSHVDPVEADLFSGRFLNEETTSMPDIDLDFPRDIREVLIPRVHDRYGRDRSALVAAFPTYRPKGAVRDLGKALGLPPAEIDRVAKTVGFHQGAAEIERDLAAALGPSRAAEPRWRALLPLAAEIMGLPRHSSQHPGGMVISTRPLIDVCPVVPAAMAGRQTVQWDKDSCADAGFLKIDLLGLGMLSAVERCVEEVGRARGERLDLSRIPLDDERVYESIRAAETTGVFQIESRAQMQMLPRTQPRDLDDLIVQVALVRPGPIQGGAVHPYIERRKLRREDPAYPIPYEHPLLEPVLEETLGTIVFQEQVIEVAMALAGFSSSEAEGLRRAMSRKRSQQAIDEHHRRFCAGAAANGVPAETAERVWGQIQGFSGFGFPKAHSAAFGLLAYQSAWLRIHYGPEFLCSLLNEQPMGFYPPDSLVHEARRRGIRVAPPDVNRSRVLCHVESTCEDETPVPARRRADTSQTTCRRDEKSTMERQIGPSAGGSGRIGPSAGDAPGGLQVRIGLGYVKGAKGEEMEALVAERDRGGPYEGIADLASRSGASLPALERLAWAGALDPARGEGRREALWRVGVAGAARAAAATQMALPIEPPVPPELEPLGEWGRLIADYRSTGLTLDKHPLALLRPRLDPSLARTSELAERDHGSTVELAGMVTARQRPETANGVTFLLLEDECGQVNLVVPPPVYERHRPLVRTAPLLRARGRLERREGTVNVLVAALAPLDAAELGAVAPAGHSFGRRG